MATYVWCELVCAHCSTAFSGEFTSGAIPRRELKRIAKARGAVFSGDEVFCSEEHRQAAQPAGVHLGLGEKQCVSS